MKVALLGPRGTYTHQAAERYFEDLNPEFCATLKEVFESDTKIKIIPIENSLEGSVSETLDLLREEDVEITEEQVLEINHCLVSPEEDISDVETVISHPQALSQCGDFLSEHHWERIESSSTAKAAEELGKGEAAISSKIAGKINDLNILGEDIQDNSANVTRFFVLNHEKGEGEKTALIVEPGEDRPGLLESILSCFSGQRINLSHIQSRPTKERLGEYYFYIEAETDKRSEKFKRALQCLKTYASVKVLGSYRVRC